MAWQVSDGGELRLREEALILSGNVGNMHGLVWEGRIVEGLQCQLGAVGLSMRLFFFF